MIHDTIVDEIHQFRAQLLAEHHGDFAAYFAALMQKQQQDPKRYASFMQPVTLQTRPLPPTPRTN